MRAVEWSVTVASMTLAAAGTATSVSTGIELLRQRAPRLRFDALECLRPVRADDYVKRSRVRDETGDGHGPRFDPLPESGALGDEPRSNALLQSYASDQDIDTQGVCYGRVVGEGGATYLQYWFFYVDNPCVLPPGRHDGDWELVQLRLSEPDRRLTHLTYAQHGGPETRRAAPGCVNPEVFVAVNSHASYFEARTQPTFPVADECDAKQQPASGLVVLEFPPTDWTAFAGRWGIDEGPGTWLARHLGWTHTPGVLRWLNRVLKAGDSPPGPSWQKSSWESPARFQRSGALHRLVPVLLREAVHFGGNLTWPRIAPNVTVDRDGDERLRIRAEPAGHLFRRVRRASVRLEDARSRVPLVMHTVPADGEPYSVPSPGDGELAYCFAGYNRLRQRGLVGSVKRIPAKADTSD